jgi:NAD(P)H-dependent FMN reductase
MDSPHVVAISGSRRSGSYTRRSLRLALEAAADAGARTDLLDLRERDLPPFDPDADEPDRVRALKRRVREADGVLLGTPVYHGSYASTLKDALDYCGREEFRDTTVGLLAVAGGGSYASTLDHLRVVVRTVHGWTVPHQVGIRNASDYFEGEKLVDEGLARRVRRLGREVTANADVEPAARTEAHAPKDP